MANIDGPKYTGDLVIDLTDVKEALVDLPPKALQGARAEKEGLAGVLGELAVAIPNHGNDAEIHPAVYQRILADTTLIAKLRGYEATLEKLLEVCRETRGMKENNREDDISAIADKVEEKADRGKKPGLRAPFEKTLRYRSQLADKAADTRKKNEQAKAEAAKKDAAAPSDGGQAPPVA
jgi:hypothetical protein